MRSSVADVTRVHTSFERRQPVSISRDPADRRGRPMLTRRQLLSGAAAGLAGPMLFGGAASAADRRCRRKTLLVSDHFTGRALNSQLWNPYICDNPSNGWPWLMQNDVAVPSSAIGGPNSFNEDYDLPSYVQVSNGLTLRCQRGSAAPGYTFTGSVICSYPTDND